MSEQEKPIVGITMGDAAGVGPEIIAMALAQDEVRAKARAVVIGDASVMADAVRVVGADLPVESISSFDPDALDDRSIWVLDLKNRPFDSLTRGKLDAAN